MYKEYTRIYTRISRIYTRIHHRTYIKGFIGKELYKNLFYICIHTYVYIYIYMQEAIQELCGDYIGTVPPHNGESNGKEKETCKGNYCCGGGFMEVIVWGLWGPFGGYVKSGSTVRV